MDSPEEPSTAAPISIFHVALVSLLPTAEDKSTASNVRREGWGLTSSTATDPFSAMLLCHVYGEGKGKAERSYLLSFYRPWPRQHSALGICWPHGKYIQRLNSRGPQGPSARNLTLHFPNEYIPGSFIYNEWHSSALSHQGFMSSCKKDFYYQQSILSVSIRSVNVRKNLLLTLNSFVVKSLQLFSMQHFLLGSS